MESREIVEAAPVEALAALEPVSARIAEIEAQVERADVTNDETLGLAGDFAKFIRAQIKIGEEKRTEITRPLDEAKRRVLAVWNPLKNRLEAAESGLRRKMNEYAREAERRRREIEAAERKRLEETALAEAEKIATRDADAADAILAIAANAPKAKSGPVRGAYGSTTSVRKTWAADVEDLDAVLRGVLAGELPRELVSIVPAELAKYGRKVGAEKIVSGIRVYQREEVVVR